MHKLEDLKIWHKALQLAKEVYTVLADMPHDEKFGLTSQMKRCAVSIASNIAEGAGRNSPKEFKQFMAIASGSSYELQTQLLLTIELKLISKEQVTPIINLLSEVQRMNYSFQKTLII
jgi:four helix bundle protein